MNKIHILNLAMGCMLLGCTKSNPLLNDDAINNIRNGVTLYSKNRNFNTECKTYVLGKETPIAALKASCDERIEITFNLFRDRDAFQQATLTDMHDVKLWQRVYQVNK